MPKTKFSSYLGIIAHRGVSSEKPENTLAGIQRAIDLSCDMVEFDVQQSKDHVPIIIHDDTLDRTTNGHGLVSHLTLKELKTLDAGSGEKIPTLEEVLTLTKNKIAVLVEIKEADPKIIIPLLSAYSSPLLVCSFFPQKLKQLSQFERVGIAKDLSAAHEHLKLGIKALSLEESLFTKKLVLELKEQNIRLFAWTVDDPERAYILTNWGVEGIITNNPAVLR